MISNETYRNKFIAGLNRQNAKVCFFPTDTFSDTSLLVAKGRFALVPGVVGIRTQIAPCKQPNAAILSLWILGTLLHSTC